MYALYIIINIANADINVLLSIQINVNMEKKEDCIVSEILI